jgi:hypothetical protein
MVQQLPLSSLLEDSVLSVLAAKIPGLFITFIQASFRIEIMKKLRTQPKSATISPRVQA